MATHSNLYLTLALSTLGLGACDPAQSIAPQNTALRTGELTIGGRRTENTGKVVSSTARDVVEFWDDGQLHTTSQGYDTMLTEISLPDPADPAQRITTVVGHGTVPGQAAVHLVEDEDVLTVELINAAGELSLLTGAALIGLTFELAVTDRGGAQYISLIEIVNHAQDELAGDLFELHRIDPDTGTLIAPLCERSATNGRYARITDGIGVEYESGAIANYGTGLRHIGCCAAAPAKAVQLGYDHLETDLTVFSTAIRVIRADYCGDGYPYTFHGNAVRLEDTVHDPDVTLQSVRDDLADDEILEAVWDAEGVICLGTPRAADVAATDIVCPTKELVDGTFLHNWTPPSCEGFVDDNPAGDLRVYSIISAPE